MTKNPPNNLPDIEIWTDGSTYPSNPGCGGYAAILYYKDTFLAVAGFTPDATNNIAETLAVYYALEILKCPCRLSVFSDSQYVLRGLGRIKDERSLLSTNTLLWSRIEESIATHTIKNLHQVPSHSGVPMNEWANELAGISARYKRLLRKNYASIPEAFVRKKRKDRAIEFFERVSTSSISYCN